MKSGEIIILNNPSVQLLLNRQCYVSLMNISDFIKIDSTKCAYATSAKDYNLPISRLYGNLAHSPRTRCVYSSSLHTRGMNSSISVLKL